jgi:glycosyltransferase involved in cell wall biosynthesis
MTDLPLVSVVMPVYNGELYLAEAIQSILAQSYRNFEFLIVDDGSTDGSPQIINKYKNLDSRVKLIRHVRNQGLVSALNTGFQAAQGKYLARMDQDDISLPERFSLQVEHLEAFPEVGLLGCRVHHIDATGRLLYVPPLYLDDLSIQWHILFQNTFYHPTVMLRKSVLDQLNLRYDPAHENAEDFGLWSRLLEHTQGENLPEVLLHYRFHSESMTERNQIAQRKIAADITCSSILTRFPEAGISADQSKNLSYSILGVSSQAKSQRSRWIYVYLIIWTGFQRKHQNEAGLSNLEHGVIAWAARMILYPPFQQGSGKALWKLTELQWRWPFFFLEKLPYYWTRRQTFRAPA